MDPRFGADGWCRTCGAPKVEQTGHLILQGYKFPKADVFMPNWSFDVIGVSAHVAAEVGKRFKVKMRSVHKPKTGATEVMQLLPGESSENWYLDSDLKAAVERRPGVDREPWLHQVCDACGTARWLPVSEGQAPISLRAVEGVASDFVASPERFGSGKRSFRHLLFRRSLGVFLQASSPRNWELKEVTLR